MMKQQRKCSSCDGDFYHYAGCAIGEHGELINDGGKHLLAEVERLTRELEAATRVVEAAREIGRGPHRDYCRGVCAMCRALAALSSPG